MFRPMDRSFPCAGFVGMELVTWMKGVSVCDENNENPRNYLKADTGDWYKDEGGRQYLVISDALIAALEEESSYC